MNYWILADTHFGHNKMVQSGLRPKDFESKILNNYRNCIKPNDILIHLGDFSFYDHELWHEKFMTICDNKKWLLRGNHDKKSNGWYFSHGWDIVAEKIELNVFGKLICFSHRPIQDYLNFDVNIHGHLHNTNHHSEFDLTIKHQLVYIEHTYTPINLRRLVE